jgi:hypothetical protein
MSLKDRLVRDMTSSRAEKFYDEQLDPVSV